MSFFMFYNNYRLNILNVPLLQWYTVHSPTKVNPVNKFSSSFTGDLFCK